MNVLTLVALQFAVSVLGSLEECIKCTEEITTDCYASCEEMINIAVEGKVYQFPVQGSADSNLTTLQFEDENLTAICSNSITGRMYISTLDGIYYTYNITAGISEMNSMKIKASWGLNNITAMEVDHTTGNLYWSDRTLSTIFVAGPNGENKSTVLVLGEKEELFDIAIDTKHGYIYWTDSNKGCVHRATLAGHTIQLVKHNLTFPTGIAIDDMYLYVMQLGEESGMPDTLVKIDLMCAPSDDCTIKYKLSRDKVYQQSRYSYIDVVGGTVYNPSVQDNDVVLTKIGVSGNISTETLMSWEQTLDDIPRLDITSYRKDLKIENLCVAANCQYLCVQSANQTTGNLTAVCLCQDGYQLSHDLTSCSSSRCVTVGGNTYCNVTRQWEPRVSETGTWLAVVIPTVFAAVALVVLAIRTIKVGYIKTVYYWNIVPIYFTHYFGEEAYKLITETPAPNHPYYHIFNKPSDCFFRVRWEEDGVHVDDPSSPGDTPAGATAILTVQDNRVLDTVVYVSAKTLRNACKVCTCITAPKSIKYISVLVAILCMPVVKVLWDIVDVGVDCYYFGQLESGDLISINITRNANINNGVLAFAVLGCLKSTILAYVFYKIVRYSDDALADYSRSDYSSALFLKPIVVCIKIFFEDGVELILEYFYVDKFVTDNQPWLLILKDVITAALYIMPIVTVIRSWRKSCRRVREEKGYNGGHFTLGNVTIHYNTWLHVYIACVIVQVTFSVVSITRVAGMVFQYTSMNINSACLTVADGYLIQTPFNSGCLNGFDYVIVTCMGIISVLFIVIIFFIVLNKFSNNANESICKKLDGALELLDNTCKFTDLTFNINGEVTSTTRVVRKDKLDYVTFHRVAKHFVEESTV